MVTAAFLTAPVSAQTGASGIAGVVKDTSGAVLPGVTVEAASPALIERVRTVVTDGEGQFKIIDLRPGTYQVTFSLPGFSTVKRDGIELRGGQWSQEEEQAFRQPILDQYEVQGHPYYATARLWDDGVIDPADTRRVLALGLSASLNAPIPDPKFGIFRM
jgi:hypothetical protein